MLTMPNVVHLIISNITPTVYIRYTAFWNFSKLVFVLHILAFTKFQLRWCAPFQLLWTLFKSSFLPLRSLWKSDLKCFQTFPNCCLLCTFWLIRNFYSGDVHHANYGKHSLNHHLRYCAHCVYQIYSVLKFFEIAVCFFTFGLLGNFYSGDAPHANHGERCSNHLFWYCANWVNQIYSLLKLFEIGVCFCTFLLNEISAPVMRTMLTMANIL